MAGRVGSPRAFLVRGLLVGLLAGLTTFGVAYVVGGPQVEAAIALEEAAAPAAGHDHEADASGGVSRTVQRTVGLALGSISIGVVLGGLVALASAAAVGRLGRLGPGGSTALVTLVGFVAFALVPFWKYPATPPAVGSGETIGVRTATYFAFVLVSVLAAVAAVVLAAHLARRHDPLVAVATGAAAYLLVVVVVGTLLPSVDEVGAFPADTLWNFRRASLLSLATTWAVLGVGLAAAVRALEHRARLAQARRDLAASL